MSKLTRDVARFLNTKRLNRDRWDSGVVLGALALDAVLDKIELRRLLFEACHVISRQCQAMQHAKKMAEKPTGSI